MTPPRGRGASTKRTRRRSRKRSGETPRAVILLGPQRAAGDELAGALADLERMGARAPGSPLATITAGWREREGEAELVPLASTPTDDAGDPPETIDLGLYAAGESLAASDPELVGAHKASQDRLKTLRRVYNRRLAALMEAYRAVGEIAGDEEIMAVEREAALEAIRALDARHLDRVAELRGAYESEWRPTEREAVRAIHERIEADLDGIDTVVIAGGHIATLLNRLRLFGLSSFLESRSVVAWSAGAMALAERVVLFHDRPPWGAGNAEAFDRGLGLVTGVIPFPHASERLALDDPWRSGRLARRFAPDACVLFDPGARLDWVDGAWSEADAMRIDRAGGRERFPAVAA